MGLPFEVVQVPRPASGRARAALYQRDVGYWLAGGWSQLLHPRCPPRSTSRWPAWSPESLWSALVPLELEEFARRYFAAYPPRVKA